jgi:hypothetical protein
MKNLYFTLCLFFFALTSYAQNWNAFDADTTRYFINEQGYVRAMRIDSVHNLGTDQVYYPFKTARGYYLDMALLDSNGGSWLGGEVLAKANGDFLFDNHWGDTVLIKTHAAFGDHWVFYNDSSASYYTATVTDLGTMNILGALDSVKRIILTSYNGTTINTADSLNGFEIILSKAHGFVQVFDLYTFPYHPADSSYNHGRDYYLDQLTDNYSPGPSNSIFRISDYNFVSAEYQYDRNVGDVYQYAQCYMASVFTQCSPVHTYMLDTIKQINYMGSTPEYITSGWRANYGMYNFMFTYHYTHFQNAPLQFCLLCSEVSTDYLPEEVGQNYHMYYFPNDYSYCSSAPMYRFSNNYIDHNSMMAMYFEVGMSYTDYKTGLGMVYRYVHASGSPEMSERELIYRVKDGIVCGYMSHPSSLSSDDLLLDEVVSISPNPVSDVVTIKTTKSGYKLRIFNTIGQEVLIKNNCSNNQQIDLSTFNPGVYYLKFESAEQPNINHKILIER